MPRNRWKANLFDYEFVAEQDTELYCIQISDRTLALLLPLLDYISWPSRYINADLATRDILEAWEGEVAGQLMTPVECGMTEPCCDLTNELLAQIVAQNDRFYALIKAGATLTFNGGAITVEPLPDCAPDDFLGNDDEDPEIFVLRKKALCLAIRRMVARITYDEFIKLGIKSRDVTVLVNSLEPLPVGSFEGWTGTSVDGLVSGDYVLIQSDPVAYEDMVCCLWGRWFNQSLSIENFKQGMNDCPPVLIPITTQDRYRKIIPYYLAVNNNFAVFGTELDRAYEDVKSDPDGYSATCGCDPVVPLPCGITTEPFVANFGGEYAATVVTQVGLNKFRFQSEAPAPGTGFPDVFAINFGSTTGCWTVTEIELVFDGGVTSPPQVIKDNASLTCADVPGSWIVVDGCYKSALLSYAQGAGQPLSSGRFYVDLTFAAECC